MPWSSVSSSLAAPWAKVTVRSAGTVRYRVRAVDAAGNVGAWAYSRVVSPRLVQQSSASIRYVGHWRIASDARYSGGRAVRGATPGHGRERRHPGDLGRGRDADADPPAARPACS